MVCLLQVWFSHKNGRVLIVPEALIVRPDPQPPRSAPPCQPYRRGARLHSQPPVPEPPQPANRPPMSTALSILRRLHAHRAWANEQLLDVVARLNDDELHQPFEI